jgi:hypothetical protein
MKLLSVDTAQSWWYGPIRDFNPRGIAWFSVITPLLAKRYKLKFISPAETKTKPDNVKFQDGEFILKEGNQPISISFTIFAGAVCAETSHSTEACDAFLTELFKVLQEEVGILPYTEIVREKKYYSQLWVSTEKTLNVLNPKLQKIATFLSKHVQHAETLKFEIGGLSFWPDQAAKFAPSPFIIERAAGIPFSENRYFSRAPLETDEHIELLKQIEAIL